MDNMDDLNTQPRTREQILTAINDIFIQAAQRQSYKPLDIILPIGLLAGQLRPVLTNEILPIPYTDEQLAAVELFMDNVFCEDIDFVYDPQFVVQRFIDIGKFKICCPDPFSEYESMT